MMSKTATFITTNKPTYMCCAYCIAFIMVNHMEELFCLINLILLYICLLSKTGNATPICRQARKLKLFDQVP